MIVIISFSLKVSFEIRHWHGITTAYSRWRSTFTLTPGQHLSAASSNILSMSRIKRKPSEKWKICSSKETFTMISWRWNPWGSSSQPVLDNRTGYSQFTGVQLDFNDDHTFLIFQWYDFIIYCRVQPYQPWLRRTDPYWPIPVLTLWLLFWNQIHYIAGGVGRRWYWFQ